MDEPKELELRQEIAALIHRPSPEGGMEILDRLLSHPQAPALIRSLEAEEFYALVNDLGRAECSDLLRYASPEQLHGFLDLDLWTEQSFLPDRVEWNLALANEAGSETVDRFFEGMDDETIGVYILRRAQIVPRTFEPEQEDALPDDREVFLTPDAMFYVIARKDEELSQPEADEPEEQADASMLGHFISLLYASDYERARSILKSLPADDADALELLSRGFRNSRLETMGFPSSGEASKLFNYYNPVKARDRILEKLDRLAILKDSHDSLLPALARHEQAHPPFLRDVFAAVDDPLVRQQVSQGMAYLINAVFVRESGGDLSSEEARGAAVSKAMGYVNMGLEFVSSSETSTAVKVIARVWPRTLFRIGFSLALMLRLRARELLKYSGQAHGFQLFDPPLDDVIKGVAKETPLYFEGLMDEENASWRDFRTLDEWQRTRAALRQAEGVNAFVQRTLPPDFKVLEETVPANLRPVVTHTTLMSTALVNAMLGRESWLAPIGRSELMATISVMLVKDELGDRKTNPKLRQALERFIATESNRFAGVLFELSLRKLEDVFLRLPEGTLPDPKLLAGVLLVTPGPAS